MLGLISSGRQRLMLRMEHAPDTPRFNPGVTFTAGERLAPSLNTNYQLSRHLPWQGATLLVAHMERYDSIQGALTSLSDRGLLEALLPPGLIGQRTVLLQHALEHFEKQWPGGEFWPPGPPPGDGTSVRLLSLRPVDYRPPLPAYLALPSPEPPIARSLPRWPWLRARVTGMTGSRSLPRVPEDMACFQWTDWRLGQLAERSQAVADYRRQGLSALVASALSQPFDPLTPGADQALQQLTEDLPNGLLERVVADARHRARVRGSGGVTPKDLKDAAAWASGSTVMVDPAVFIPEHHDEVVEKLSQLKKATLRLSGGGTRPPRVLVVGETSGIVARAFQQAGADVATCDLKPSECPDVPHYQGDASLIQDRNWDLVITHPPCTFLANAGIGWLHRDKLRWDSMLQNAAVFRRMHQARAPHVATENSKMHPYGRALIGGLRPTQYVHPWQHGTGHTKPTALYLKNLPALHPTCVVKGREHALARLPPSEDRQAHRSRTYPGIAAAMATQWMPRLLEYVQAPTQERSECSAAETVETAQRAATQVRNQVAFIRRNGGLEVLARMHRGTSVAVLPTSYDEAPMTLASKQLFLPASWHEAYKQALELTPSGDCSFHCLGVAGETDTLLHVWIVDVSSLGTTALPYDRIPTEEEVAAPLRWVTLKTICPVYVFDELEYRRALLAACRGPIQPLARPATVAAVPRVASRVVSQKPWLEDQTDPPVPPATPRNVRLVNGRWRVWAADVSLPRADGVWQYRWHLLPDEIADSLDTHLSLPCRSLPTVAEPRDSTKERNTIGTWKRMCKPKTEVHGTETQDAVALAVTIDVARQSFERSREDMFERMWNQRPPFDDQERVLGLGATLDTPFRPRLPGPRKMGQRGGLTSMPPGLSRARRSYLRAEYGQLKVGQREVSAVSLDGSTGEGSSSGENPLAEGLDSVGEQGALEHWLSRIKESEGRLPVSAVTLRERMHVVIYQSPLRMAAPVLTHETSPATEVRADELTESPCSFTDIAQHALYVRGVSVLRPSTSRRDPGSFFHVGCSLMTTNVLADTGAAPSIITTELLAQLPKECVRERNEHLQPFRVNGANGQPLCQRGTVALALYLGRMACEQTFIVVEGAPLMILGNDFLSSRRAEIKLNVEGDGEGVIQLSSVNPARPQHVQTHEVRVTTAPYSASAVSVAAADRVDRHMPPRLKRAPLPPVPHTAALPVATPPAEFATEAVTNQGWKVQAAEHLLYSSHPIRLPARSRVTVRLKVPLEMLDRTPSCLITPLPHRPGLEDPPQVIPRVVTIQEGSVDVEIWNTRRCEHTVAAHIPIAMLDAEYCVRGSVDPGAVKRNAQGNEDHVAALSEEQLKILEAVVVDPQGRLKPEQKEQVRQLLAKHITAFAVDPKNPTRTHLMDVELPLEDPNPVRHAPSRLGEAGREIVEQHVADMESRGIIRKSNSAWGSRVVLVTKKDGSIRFCVDFRDVNSKLKVQDSPLPLTVEAIDRLSSGKGDPSTLFLCTLDLASGFWTLPIKEEDKHITAFVTHQNKYEFNVLPFGIQSGPSYMCRLMQAALQGLSWEVCMPYLDDVGIWSTGTGTTFEEREDNSFKQMMERLAMVLERLKWAGLSMKASKCVLFATEAEYLGHLVTRSGLHMDPKKVEAVSKIDPTSINTLEKVRSFMGLVSYYRRFIAGFAKIATPLTNLTQAGVDVAVESQKPECQQAVRELIKLITSEPILAAPRFDRPFILKTDGASGGGGEPGGVGGVLSQLDDEGHERVVGYYNRRLTKHERRYSVTEIELLGVVESVKNWRPYLWGREFKLVIDHAALRWLHTMRDTMEGGPASRLMRWILRLSEYRFTVEHKPGKIHSDADGVSRLTREEEGSGPDDSDPPAGSSKHQDWLAKLCAHIGTDGSCSPPEHVEVARAEDARRVAALTARQFQRTQRSKLTRDEVITSYLATGAPTLDQMREEQATDDECLEYRQWLEGRSDPPQDSDEVIRAGQIARQSSYHIDGKVYRRMAVQDEVLYRVAPDKKGNLTSVPFVPKALRGSIMMAFHDHLGHPATSRTLSALKARYFWPGMDREVSNYVKSCHQCQLAKHPAVRGRAPVGPTTGRYPFDVLYADILTMTPTHDYVKGKSGATKLIVFVDSLSRWVEAIPVNQEPTSGQILDIFMEHVVSRYGMPRRVITDHGSNFASRLAQVVMEKSGVRLTTSTAEHHEAVGLVERFHRTLLNMTRAADDTGGKHWADHLPFLLMSYRATTHRVTQMTPAQLLYGRELRLPAQLGEDAPPPSTLEAEDDMPEAVRTYALEMHRRLAYAWHAAHYHTREQQEETVAETTGHALRGTRDYEVGDQVARRLYETGNKLEYVYAGPYRVEAVLGNGRYRLRDLENRLVFDEFDVSNLRPYHNSIDAEDLADDEYVVEALINRRKVRQQVQYLVKWRGFAASYNTWEPKEEMMRRCDDLVEAYDREHPVVNGGTPTPPLGQPLPAGSAATSSPKVGCSKCRGKGCSKCRGKIAPAGSSEVPAPSGDVSPSEVPKEAADRSARPEGALSHELGAEWPRQAKYERGEWFYLCEREGPKGVSKRWFPSTRFTAAEIESDHFAALRHRMAAVMYADGVVAAVFHEQMRGSARTGATALILRDPQDVAGTATTPQTNPSSAAAPRVKRAAKVWFMHGRQACSFYRADSDPGKPNPDTFGGTVEAADYHQPGVLSGSTTVYVHCLNRELEEEAGIPRAWYPPLRHALRVATEGHYQLNLRQTRKNISWTVAYWFVELPACEVGQLPKLRADGVREVMSGSLKWRPFEDLIRCYQPLPFLQPLMEIFESKCLHGSPGSVPPTRAAEADCADAERLTAVAASATNGNFEAAETDCEDAERLAAVTASATKWNFSNLSMMTIASDGGC